METLNLVLSIAGIVGWGYVWTLEKYRTGRTVRTQIGVMLLGLMWIMLFLADTCQGLVPTSLTVCARIILGIAFWCMMPLLRDNSYNSDDNQDEQT